MNEVTMETTFLELAITQVNTLMRVLDDQTSKKMI